MSLFIGPSEPMPDSRCPHCGWLSDRRAPIAENPAIDGPDVTVCLGCSNVLIYADDRLREPNEAELLRLLEDRPIREALAGLQRLIATYKATPEWKVLREKQRAQGAEPRDGERQEKCESR